MSNSDNHQQKSGNKPGQKKYQAESLEPRILLSATWVSADGGEEISAATSNDDIATGGDANDVIKALDGNDKLFGNGGDDRLYGQDGDDQLDGGDGNDRLDGGSGTDSILGGDGRDRLYGKDGDDRLDGGAGNDRIFGGSGADQLRGGDGNDILYADGQDTVIDGGDGRDSLYQRGDGSINLDLNDASIERVDLKNSSDSHNLDADGKSEAVWVRGGNASDTIRGGENNDRLYGQDGDDSMDGGAGNDRIDGGSGADSIQGGDGHDRLYGKDGDDRLDGGAGNDRILGGSGADQLRGGDGNDILYADGQDTVIDGGDGRDSLYQRGDGSINLDLNDASIERVDLKNSSDSHNLDADGKSEAVWVRGGNAGDTIRGGENNDRLYGQDGDDSMHGGAGNDRIDGGSGADSIQGGDGHDRLYGKDGDDRLDGGAGNDRIFGGSGADQLRGGDGNDILYADGQDTVIDGGDGRDSLYQRGDGSINLDLNDASIERVDLKNSSDSHNLDADGKSEAVWVRGGNADDTIRGGENNDRLYGQDGDDSMDGGAGNDRIDGGSGADSIQGGDGHDRLYGKDGDDQLDGGAGNDRIDGGDGDDKVVFSGNRSDYEVTENRNGTFTIVDGRGIDGRDVVSNVETFEFADGIYAADQVDNEPPELDLNFIVAGTPVESVNDVIEVGEGTKIQMFADASDPENQDLSYQWEQTAGPSVTLSDTAAANAEFVTPTVSQPSQLGFRLEVSDGEVATIEEINFVITPANDADLDSNDPTIDSDEAGEDNPLRVVNPIGLDLPDTAEAFQSVRDQVDFDDQLETTSGLVDVALSDSDSAAGGQLDPENLPDQEIHADQDFAISLDAAKTTDWSEVEIGEIIEVDRAGEADEEKFTMEVPVSESESDSVPVAESELGNTVNSSQAWMPWLWSMVRAFGGTTNESKSDPDRRKD